MKIEIVNKKTHTPTWQDFYIGRGSALGNPFSDNQFSKAEVIVGSREESISRFKDFLMWEITNKGEKENPYLENRRTNWQNIRNALNKIVEIGRESGIVYLVCFCYPLACHGEVIRDIVISRYNESLQA